MRSRVIAVVAAFSVLLTAGMASAAMDDSEADTGFTFGYDPDARVFFTGIQDYDEATLDCSLAGEYQATYEEGDDGEVTITGLSDDDGEVGFHQMDDGEGEELGGEPIEPTLYGAAPECTISGAAVGTNGIINHGQFMKLFNQLVDMQGRGCLNRYLAGSSLGKDTQQVKGGDDEGASGGEVAITEGSVSFTNVQATCDHGNKEQDEDHPSLANKENRADKDKGRPDDGDDDDSDDGGSGSPGKSGDAPGRHKDK